MTSDLRKALADLNVKNGVVEEYGGDVNYEESESELNDLPAHYFYNSKSVIKVSPRKNERSSFKNTTRDNMLEQTRAG